MVSTICAETACVMFHDLTSPYVAAGLSAMAAAGWQTGWYNTMQIVGIAWRGDFSPVSHRADPDVPHLGLSYLSAHRLLSHSNSSEPFTDLLVQRSTDPV